MFHILQLATVVT